MQRTDSIITRPDCVKAIFFYLFVGGIFIGLVEIVGLIALSFLFVVGFLVKFRNTLHKSHYSAPYERCEGCGNIYSDSEISVEKYRFCRYCLKATEEQKEFAVQLPMIVKRLIL